MRTLRYRSRDESVYLLNEILEDLGYEVTVQGYFNRATENAVKAFQKEHRLVVDGIVGPKTWSKLIAAQEAVTKFNTKFLAEEDLEAFASNYNLPLAVVKAVNQVESNGKGFLLDGRPKILFEGHVFWRQLKNKGLDPQDFVNKHTEDVLYPKWTSSHYEGGAKEYFRLTKAAGMSDLPEVHEAAYESASYGSFQIMGFHWKRLGYPSIDAFVAEQYTHERAHLEAFGRYLKAFDLLELLRTKQWSAFAKAYNGPSYAKHNYHGKLAKAYERYA
ncbi:N-acetylmuramidase domain-containing protein [Croceiramulus getboli]|nr:N-acetylmuramidase domain-containing protein [Flavobacteriaceae bacterium YJPT1-3]